MNLQFRQAIITAILGSPNRSRVVRAIEVQEDGTGTIFYNTENLAIDPAPPAFLNGSTPVSDEELVRAYLLVRLASVYGYPAQQSTLHVERVYKPVGRPIGKGGRIDILVRSPGRNAKLGDAYLFIECKAPSKYDADVNLIDGQLFRLSRQETPAPRYLVYYTAELKSQRIRERIILIDTETFPTFEAWNVAGQPITDAIPARYGVARKRRYANVIESSENALPLDRETTPETFNRLRSEIHDVIWGGGGTNNNEVFVYVTKMILCKIFDEKEALPGAEYRFQRLGDAVNPESPDEVTVRLNDLYRQAEDAYLALPNPTEGPAFDTNRISAEKIAYVVGRLEGISITENVHPGDLLGEFFEQIVSQDFTQTRGQFFTPVRLVRFMLYLCNAAEQARHVMLNERDHLGRPRLPYVIDPSCGSGTFLIEYMKLIRSKLCETEVISQSPNRVREAHGTWFSGPSDNSWAREYLFGIENNYDLGLAAKVNMVLHGDGSMNTWISNALYPFDDYWIEGRHNLLGVSQQPISFHPYGAPRNEQFDLVLSNPPFSVRFSADEKNKIEESFDVMAAANSEAIFIERWYQLLREGGRLCCILPEAILDTVTNLKMRLFLLRFFRIEAVVSLPYDTFRPFTSTKTCIVMAAKRSRQEVISADKTEQSIRKRGLTNDREVFALLVAELGWDKQPIFMAEPRYVGYKRRKNLPDLPMPNELYAEAGGGQLERINVENPSSVLDYFVTRQSISAPSAIFGFVTTLSAICKREHLRLDPKYRWLWDYQDGVVFGPAENAEMIGTVVELVELPKVAKGELAEERRLVDLEGVESRFAFLSDEIPMVGTIGSDKVLFRDCEFAMAKLEPYLAKLYVAPEPGTIGSTEWFGLKRRKDYPLLVLIYLLMLPELCEAYRRLQSGKRHARFDPKEFLELKVAFPTSGLETMAIQIERGREEILALRQRQKDLRNNIDQLFR